MLCEFFEWCSEEQDTLASIRQVKLDAILEKIRSGELTHENCRDVVTLLTDEDQDAPHTKTGKSQTTFDRASKYFADEYASLRVAGTAVDVKTPIHDDGNVGWIRAESMDAVAVERVERARQLKCARAAVGCGATWPKSVDRVKHSRLPSYYGTS